MEAAREHPMYPQWLREREGIMNLAAGGLSSEAMAAMREDETVGFFGWLAALEARAAVNELTSPPDETP